MSHNEIHSGKLRKVNLQNKSKEEYAELKIKQAFPDFKLTSYYNDYTDVLLSKFNYIILNNELYELIDHIEHDGSYINMLSENSDGTLTFISSFYNGGTCLEEMLEDAINDLNKNK